MMQFCSSIGSLSGLCRTGIFCQTKSYPLVGFLADGMIIPANRLRLDLAAWSVTEI